MASTSQTTAQRRSSAGTLIALHLLLMVYSTNSILSKLAAGSEFGSLRFILLYGGVIALLGIYAIGWQQVIKHIPLSVAYANKAVTLIWGIIWGAIVFHEGVTPLKLLGAAIVLAGVVLFSTEEGEAEDASAKGTPVTSATTAAASAESSLASEATSTELTGGDAA